MNRTEFQELADARVEDARALLAAGRWAAAYHLLGYAVECALKACICRRFGAHEVPDKDIVNQFYTHKIEKLLELSEEKPAKETQAKAEPAFEINWQFVCAWTEASRYDVVVTERRARDMMTAVSDAVAGALPWVKTVW